MLCEVNVWDMASYPIEAESEEEAKMIASDFWVERCPHFNAEPIKSECEFGEKGNIFHYLIDLLSHRATDEERDSQMRLAYDNALTMLTYAMLNDWTALGQFDDRET